ncbi:MAG: cytochrome c, partial [Gammaproteobacteria bacterium]|nr:cytochrome c [Gammaproteobacteria bacterium]
MGKAVYNYRCYFCHGYSGDAKTLASTYLSPKPVSFISKSTDDISQDYIARVVSQGKPGTAMMNFSNTLSSQEIEAVAYFVYKAFVQEKAHNTRYHTVENGWKNHEQYKDAFPFATGEISLDTPWESLSPSQRKGK